jgi:RimJ/RimL family protein N-acetyltransferase
VSGPKHITFRSIVTGDYPVLEEWLRRPHWREWWGDPDVELGHVKDMAEGRDTTCRPFIFSIDGEAMGYIQVWRIGLHQVPAWTEDNPWLLELPSDAVGVDLSIAHADRLSQGIGSAALKAFIAKLRAEGHTTIIIDPDPENRRAVAAYQKAGFRPVPHLEGRTEGVLIMHHVEQAP